MLEVEAAVTVPDGVVAVGVPVLAGAVAGEGDDHTPLGWLVQPDAVRAVGETVRALLPGSPEEAWLRGQGFSGGKGTALVLRAASGPPSVVLLGLGPRAGADPDRWRLAAAALVRAAGEARGTAALLVPDEPPGGDPVTVAAAIAEGASLASYRFDAYRSAPMPGCVDRLVVVGHGEWAAGLEHGAATARATAFARDLVNTPASDMTPRDLADRVRERLSGLDGTSVEVWDEDRIAAERLGGLLAVARGSGQPPRLVWATYTPPGDHGGGEVPHVVLVGKGITFDSGGLSLKPPDGMMTMKTDMSGAAIVLSVVSACAGLGVRVKVTAIAPMTENMPGGRAQKPGDVLTARNGATVEVLNTDAEGRLVLADGLSLGAELSPDAIIDVATLTGAQVIALGRGFAALLGNDDALMTALQAAGARAGERLWPLPLPDDYREHIESEIADMKNIGKPREAGTIAAAMLLARFVDGVPWAHLDIAGPARSEESSGYVSKGATAFGVRALLEYLTHYPTAGG
ncbi:MAG: leucyl aminopeptidase [Actinomycetota bacterium]|nr:leucyl aminopeptidase [Actinomycetota bacterium]MDA8314347.1 leucyl aminopeptidase [Actinomycetota bacterium]